VKIFLLSVPYDSGHHNERMGAGPAVLVNTLKEKLSREGHEISVAEAKIDHHFPTEVTGSFQVMRQVANHVHEAKTKGEFPIVLAGNCSTSIGTLAGLNNNSGIVWFDSHADFNTPETSISGFLDGMSLSMATGHCWKQLVSSVKGFSPVAEARVILIGARDIDDLEVKNLSPSGINLITPTMLRENPASLQECFAEMETVYLHIDMDVIDAKFARANAYATEGGLSPDEFLKMLATIKNKYRISAVALTAYDPSMDGQRKIPNLANKIVELVTD
jgi:arginase